jgi:hypothetical protein
MRFLDDLIVSIAVFILRAGIWAGVVIVYVQVFVLAVLVAMAGTVTLAVAVVAAKSALFGG